MSVTAPNGLHIPSELRDETAWLCWRLEMRKNGPTKVPYSARTHRLASSTNPETWSTFEEANLERVRHKPSYSGIGRAITAPRVGVDLDHCRDPETGVIAPWALRIVRLLDSYTEISPSGTGLHIWVLGDWTAGWNNKRGLVDGVKVGVEVYRSGKYFTFTGATLEGAPLAVNERSVQLAQLAADPIVFDVPASHTLVATTQTPATQLNDTALLERMFACSIGTEIRRLWDDTDGGNASDGDWALIDHLLYWTDYDSIRSDALFRQSKRMRDKWDERHFSNGETYGAGTIRRRMERKLKTRTTEATQGVVEPGQIVTAAALQKMVFPPRVHIVKDLITKGLSVLAGKSKYGKSWMILDISIAVAEGGMAMGCIPCEQGSVLYLALEDGLDRIQERMQVLIGNRDWPPKLHLVTEWPTMDDPLCLTPIEKWLKATPDAKMVVIDVFQRFRPQATKGLNMYQQDYKDAAPLQQFARKYGVAVVLLHHVNKMKAGEADDIFDAISGSTGLPGAADTPMVLRKVNKTNATLYLRGRDVGELEYALVWNHTTAGWVIVGDAETVTLSVERREVLELFKERRTLSPRFLVEVLGLTSEVARQRLVRMRRDGLLLRTEEGTYVLALQPPVTGVTPVTAVTGVTPVTPLEGYSGHAKVTPPVTPLPGGEGAGVTGVTVGLRGWPLHAERAAHPEAFCQTCPRQLMADDEKSGGYCRPCMEATWEHL